MVHDSAAVSQFAESKVWRDNSWTMSAVKDLIVEDERKYSAAIRVDLEAGQLVRCDLICGEIYEQHFTDPLRYRIGNAWISQGDPRIAPFKNTAADRKQLAGILADLWTDFPDQCRCRSLRYED